MTSSSIKTQASPAPLTSSSEQSSSTLDSSAPSASPKDSLGDRVKALEQAYAGQKLDENSPLLVRLDGKAFHTFTKGLKRPFDARLSKLMIDTMNFLVESTDARLGYTQSDEITLVYFKLNPTQQPYFSGKVQKLASVLSSMATAYFNKNLEASIPEKKESLPIFDCRVWSVPAMSDAAEVFLWRQEDAVKNSITMAAGAHYSHSDLQNKSSRTKIEMLKEIGIDYFALPDFFKVGTYARRAHKLHDMPKGMEHLKGNSKKDKMMRSSIENFYMPDLRGLANSAGSLEQAVFDQVYENHSLVMAHKEEVRLRKFEGSSSASNASNKPKAKDKKIKA